MLVFLSFIVIVYVLAVSVLVRLVLHRFGYAALSMSPAQAWLRRLVLAFAGIGVLCFAYAYFVEPYWLSVTHIKITSSKLPRGAQPIRRASP